jgi:EAL domain-containing protein (putative c-di-GMP-specific phosphodiesterase class I)
LLEACCRQVAEWQKQSRLAPPLTLSVKVSARQFHSPSLESDVMHALEAAALAPDCLLLEISEAALLHDFEAAVARLWALRHRGVRMAIDGFGTGYSSLPMLQQLPIDALRLRLAGLAQDDGTDGLDKACALAAMATSLDMEVMAEGIDTAEQAATLLGWGCTMGQGGLYHAPLDGPAAEELVHAVARSRVVGRAKASAAPLRRRSPGHHGPDDPRREARPGPRPDWPDEAADAVQAFPDEPRPGPRSRHTAAGGSLPCRAPDRAGSSQPP